MTETHDFPFPEATLLEAKEKGGLLQCRIFPETAETCIGVAFHGTTWESFEKIQKEGFQPINPALASSSFAKTSIGALTHLFTQKNAGRDKESRHVIVMVDLKGLKVSDANSTDIYLYDHDTKNQPRIIGYSTIPDAFKDKW